MGISRFDVVTGQVAIHAATSPQSGRTAPSAFEPIPQASPGRGHGQPSEHALVMRTVRRPAAAGCHPMTLPPDGKRPRTETWDRAGRQESTPTGRHPMRPAHHPQTSPLAFSPAQAPKRRQAADRRAHHCGRLRPAGRCFGNPPRRCSVVPQSEAHSATYRRASRGTACAVTSASGARPASSTSPTWAQPPPNAARSATSATGWSASPGSPARPVAAGWSTPLPTRRVLEPSSE